MLSPTQKSEFVNSMQAVQDEIAITVISKGFRTKTTLSPRNQGELIALMHSELSEGLEAMRKGNPPSEHIPDFSGLEEEMADTVIRIMDFCSEFNLRLGDAILVKMGFNANRPHKHGKQF